MGLVENNLFTMNARFVSSATSFQVHLRQNITFLTANAKTNAKPLHKFFESENLCVVV